MKSKTRAAKFLSLNILLILLVFVSISFISAYTWNSSLNNGLVGYWNFAGNSTADASGNQPNGIINNAWFVPGKINNGIMFNGTSYASFYVNLTNNFTETTPLTISYWVYTPSGSFAGPGWGLFAGVNNYVTGWVDSSWNGFNNFEEDLGGGNFVPNIMQGNYYTKRADANTALIRDAWTHYVIVYNGILDSPTTYNYWIYQNGILIAAPNMTWGSTGAGTPLYQANLFTVGGLLGNAVAASHYLISNMSEIGLWNRPLSPNEVSQLYNGGSGIEYNYTGIIPRDCLAMAKANGASVTVNGNNCVYTFITNGSIDFINSTNVSALVVAGGGGGGGSTNSGSGGGGAGGLIYNTSYIVNGSVDVVVGLGGNGGVGGDGVNGGNSTFGTLNAMGGGGGGGIIFGPGLNGGSGGGAGETYPPACNGGTGFPGQGNNAGCELHNSCAPGGGGSGQVGGNTTADGRGANGGNGTLINITGISTYYAGGGGGSGVTYTSIGGLGGGGNGGNYLSILPTDALNETGSGGGGGEVSNGGKGGSGIVIISFQYNSPITIANCSSISSGGIITTSGNKCINTFTTNDTFNISKNVNAAVLVVAGGGGGGGNSGTGAGGGGGAGGLIYNNSYNINSGSMNVIVGLGGAGAGAGAGYGANGQNSSFGTIQTLGGGSGGFYPGGNDGLSGGSGGGAGQCSSYGLGFAGQGNNGGQGVCGGLGGGGGGSSSTGYDAQSWGVPQDGLYGRGGYGGNGTIINIGYNICYAGGGGGSGGTGSPLYPGGATTCGGGSGGNSNIQVPQNGVNGLGGGGGGTGGASSYAAGNGGTGVVIISYDYAPLLKDPNVILITPTDNSYQNTNQNFTANVSDSVNLTNATLYIFNSSNSIVNTTTFTLTGMTQTTIGTIVSLVDGIYHWSYNVFNSKGDNNIANNNTVTIDTIYPQIVFIPPTLNNSASSFYSYITAAVNVTETNEANITFNLYNYTITQCFQESPNVPNQSGLDGNCGLNYSGNTFQDGTWDITYPGTLALDGNWTTFARGGYIAGSGNESYIYENYTTPINAIDATLLFSYQPGYNDSRLMSIYNCFNTSKIMIQIKADNLNQEKSCYNGTTWIQFEASSSGGGSTVFEDAMVWNVINPLNSTTLGPGNRTFTWSNLLTGNYNYNVMDCDLANNCNSTETRNLLLYIAYPNGTLITPVNNSYNNTNQNFTVNITDVVGIKNATLNIYGPNNTLECLSTGGTVTRIGNTCINTFTTNGTFIVNSGTLDSLNVTVLVVAGGGGGGDNYGTGSGGGGGAGGFIYNNSYIVNGNIPVTVGIGGAGRTTTVGGNGGNSTFGVLNAMGGGGGGSYAIHPSGIDGGSGGGIGQGTGSSPGNSFDSQGNRGGYASTSCGGAGGGGAGTIGIDCLDNAYGGNGTLNNITGTPTYYAGGGGGGIIPNINNTPALGGGGKGVSNSETSPCTNGTNGLGGGGGGAQGITGRSCYGGSGVVIISYQAVNAKILINQTTQTFSKNSCYQETTNQFTGTDDTCGLNYTGSYNYTGFNSSTAYPAYDGNWNTAAYGPENTNSYVYINYTKPANAQSSSLIMIKMLSQANFTIPFDCWSAYANTLEFRYFDYNPHLGISSSNFSCYNGAGWELILDPTDGSPLYEEAMIWNVPTNINPGVLQYLLGIPVTLTDGIYNWFYKIFNYYDNPSVTNNNTFIKDTINPQINYIPPTPNSGITTSNDSFTVAVSAIDINLNNATFYLYNSTNLITSSNINKPFSQTFTNLITGIYYYNVTVFDLAGNYNSTETRNITIDRVIPIFLNQWDNSYNLTNSGIGLFNITVDNTNGTVYLNIHSQNILASNLSHNIYNASYYFNSPTSVCGATGGNITIVGDYCIHTFTTNDTFNISENNLDVTVLVVAGGGSGGNNQGTGTGGGGGGGGVIYNTSYIVNGSINVVVGLGGDSNTEYGGVGESGQNSTFGLLNAMGGGGGGTYNGFPGLVGGSGGGAGQNSLSRTCGFDSQGNCGGNGDIDGGGGGGGAGTNGIDALGDVAGSSSGGNGTLNNITGTPTYYAGGGGGGRSAGIFTQYGGLGGGGDGKRGSPLVLSTSGTNGTGGGGGGGNGFSPGAGSPGGSGIVIVKYKYNFYKWIAYGNGTDNIRANSNIYNYTVQSVAINLISPPNNTVLVRTNNVTLNITLNGTTTHNWTVTFYNATNATTNTSIGIVNDVTTTVGAGILLTNLVYGQVYKWFVSITDGISTFISPTNQFVPNNEPGLLNLRIEQINATSVLVMWQNEPDMSWVAFRIGNDIIEVRSITSVADNWTVNGLYPNQQYLLEYQTGDFYHAISDYHGFYFRTLGWKPGYEDYPFRRLITVNASLVGTDKNNWAVNVSLNDTNFQYYDAADGVWYPSFLHLNYTTLNNIRFVDYYDINELPYNVTYKNIPGIGGLSYQTIPNSNYTIGTIITPENAHDGSWSTNAIPNPTGSFYYNYTRPVGAKTTSMFRISDSGWGWDIQLPIDCYGPVGTDIEFRSDANRTGIGAGYVITYCLNRTDNTNWILVRNNLGAGPYFFETMMTWQYSTQANIAVIPRHFDNLVQSNVPGIDGDYNVKFWMYYGDPDGLNNESVLNYSGIDNNPLIYGPEVSPELPNPIIFYLNDTNGRTATGTNISWSVDQIVDNRLKISTNAYLLNNYFYSYITNTTQYENSLTGNEAHVLLTTTSPSEYIGMVNVSCSNSSYNNNYTVNSTTNPVTITIPNLNTIEFLDWNFTYEENKSWFRQTANVTWPVTNLTTNMQYWYEANAYGVSGNGTATGTFILGSLPSTPTIGILNYSEYRPTKTVTICANLTSLNSNPNVNVSFEYWNQTDTGFKETTPVNLNSVGPFCADISVNFGEINNYVAKAVGTTTGYSTNYSNEVLPIQQFFAGNTVDDNNNAPLDRQYCPPNLDGTVNLNATCYEQEGYREGSLQPTTSMYVETNASIDVLTLHLYLLNGTLVSNTIMNISGYGFEYTTLNNLGQNFYTFYITNSTGLLLNWTKPGMTHMINQNRIDVSKYVSFNGTSSPFNYTLMYLNNPGVYNTSAYNWCQAAPGGNLFDCMSVQYWGTYGNSLSGTAYDRGQFFRGGVTNGEIRDSGVLDYTKNSSAPLGDFRQCFAFTVFYFDESKIPNNNITNYRYVYWRENQHFSDYNGKIENTTFHDSYLFNWAYDTLSFTRDWKSYPGTETDKVSVVKTVDASVFKSNFSQSLLVGSQSGFNVNLTNDNQYNFGLYNDGDWINQQIGKYQDGYVIFNLPDNATLHTLDSDGDGISDFDEVYIYYTNPKNNDTDGDGYSDGYEISHGTDPLLYNSHPAPSINLTNPANNSYQKTNQNFSADISTNSGINSTNLYINNVLTDTYTAVGNVFSISIGFVKVLSDGAYSWFYNMIDNTGVSTNSTTNNVIIDKTLPNITIISPANLTYTQLNKPTSIVYSYTETNPYLCWYSLNNGVMNTTTPCGLSVTGLNPNLGSNTWMIIMEDYASNINQANITFYVNNNSGILANYTYPTEISGSYINRSNILINVSAIIGTPSDFANTTILLYGPSSQNTLGLTNPFFIDYTGLSDGIYSFNAITRNIYGDSDIAGLRNVTIDTINPTMDYSNPTIAAGTYNQTSSIWANMTATDTNLLLISSTLELISGGVPYTNTQNITPTLEPIDSLYYNWTGLGQGVYRLSGYAIDKVGLVGYITNRTIVLNIGAPIMNYEFPTPTDGTVLEGNNNFIVNVSALDPTLTNQIIYYWQINGTIQSQTTSNAINTLTLTGLADGIYYFNATGTDVSGRVTWLPTRNVDIEYSNQNITSCKELARSGSTYLIQNDLTSASTCLNVTVPDITIDCQGHTIQGNSAILSTKTGLTIRNCNLESAAISLKIKGNSPSSVSIYNSTITGGTYGIYLAPEASLYADTITITGCNNGIYINNSNNGNNLKNVIMTGNTQGLVILNSSYNTIRNLNITSGGATFLTTSTDNNFISCNINSGIAWTFTDYSVNNNIYSSYYSGSENVDGTSQLIRSWSFTGSVVDKALNKMNGASIVYGASSATNTNVSYKNSSLANLTYGTLGGSMVTNDLGLASTNITQYINIFGTTYSSTPYYFNASYGKFAPTTALLNINDSSISRYHQFVLGNEIASSSLSRTAIWLLLGLIFLIAMAASIGFFMVRMREGYSIVDSWKYLIILVIWMTIFLIIYWALAWYIMGTFYPKI